MRVNLWFENRDHAVFGRSLLWCEGTRGAMLMQRGGGHQSAMCRNIFGGLAPSDFKMSPCGNFLFSLRSRNR